MTSQKKKNNFWLILGVIVLVLALIWWLYVAMFTGDTDVAAFIPALF